MPDGIVSHPLKDANSENVCELVRMQQVLLCPNASFLGVYTGKGNYCDQQFHSTTSVAKMKE